MGYRLNERYRFALNIENLFDEKYWEHLRPLYNHNYYGAPRRVTLTVRFSL